MKKDGISPPDEAESSWTRIDTYLRSINRRRLLIRRRHRSARPAHDPEPPRLLLGTVPFLMLAASLAVLAGAIIIMARPGAMRTQAEQAAGPPRVPPREIGTAPPGWFEEAKKEFR